MDVIYKLSPIKHLVYMILLPIMIDATLALACYYISKAFILVLIGVFYVQFIWNLIYEYNLGKKIYFKLECKENQELKKYRMIILYMGYTGTVFISVITNLMIEHIKFELSIIHIVLIVTIAPALIFQYYIPKFQAMKLVEAEKKLLNIDSDYDKTRLVVRDITYFWKLKIRINKILEFEDKKENVN
ncbi:MAG: hypothetical protein WCH34_13030 [Bacteroidota bacterium]